MSKVYDRVEWDYLRVMMIKLGFPSAFVNLVMEVVTTARYQICHEGGQV